MAHLLKAQTYPGGRYGPVGQLERIDHERSTPPPESATDNETEGNRSPPGPSRSQKSEKSEKTPHLPVQANVWAWWLEILSGMVICLALAALYITAATYNDKPNPHWPQGLSINSLFSIYVVVLKAAMLTVLGSGINHLKWSWFSRARPLRDLATYSDVLTNTTGSLWLLIQLHGRDIMSTCAALIMVAAVVIDPITQEIIRYPSCLVSLPASAGASLQRTNSYTDAQGSGNISHGLELALNAGSFNSGTPVGFKCPSGDCTFTDLIRTFGYTHHCEDVTNELRCTNIEDLANSTEAALQFSSHNVNYTTYSISLPSGLNASYQVESSLEGGDVVVFEDDWLMDFNKTTTEVELIMGAAPFKKCNVDPTITWEKEKYGAARCTLKPAILAINASIAVSKLHEITNVGTEIFGTGSAGCPAFSTVYIPCLNHKEQDNLTSAGYDLSSGHDWLPLNDSWSCDQDGRRIGLKNTIIPPACVYTYAHPLTDFFNSYFPGYVGLRTADFRKPYNGSAAFAGTFINRRVEFAIIDEIFANISTSMTSYVRNHGDAGLSEAAIGSVLVTQTCIRVRWLFLIYPTVLGALTIGFLVALVIRDRAMSGKNGLTTGPGMDHAVKDNPTLALLVHGLDVKTLDRVEALAEGGGTTKLVKAVEDMPVRLRQTDRGWKLVAEEEKDVP